MYSPLSLVWAEYFSLFTMTKFEDTQIFSSVTVKELNMTFIELEKIVDYIHKDIMGALLMWILILGHISAALYHTYIKKDQTLYKMTREKQR